MWLKYVSLRHKHCPFPPRLQLRPKGLLQSDLRWFLETVQRRCTAHCAWNKYLSKAKAAAGLLTITVGANSLTWYETVSTPNTERSLWTRAQHNKASTSLGIKLAHRTQCIAHPSKSCSCAQDSGVWMSELGQEKAEDAQHLLTPSASQQSLTCLSCKQSEIQPFKSDSFIVRYLWGLFFFFFWLTQ